MSLNPEISFVIPVYNGSNSISYVVDEIHKSFANSSFEIVLVNDGSADRTEKVCLDLLDSKKIKCFVQLSKNYGEHNAVLAGLSYASGSYIAVLDDDGQNPPREVKAMIQKLQSERLDVVYGHYIEKKHSGFRNLGSKVNDFFANILLKKPPNLYLSSFKVMNSFLVKEITKYRGPFPYIDGLILRTTNLIGSVPVDHKANYEGRSNYSLKKLLKLWSNMFLSFSILPLRIAVYLGVLISAISGITILGIIVDKIWINPHVTPGIPTVLAAITFFSGVQLLILGVIGEYLGRLYLDQTLTPQFVARYVKHIN